MSTEEPVWFVGDDGVRRRVVDLWVSEDKTTLIHKPIKQKMAETTAQEAPVVVVRLNTGDVA